jgi:hypothetical protein
MVWQRAGTVSVQNGSTTVTGAGVDFAASSRVGDSFVGPDGATYEVANVASATVISILPAYKGATVSGAAYAIMPVQGYDKMLSDAFNSLNNQFGPKLAALGTTGNYDILPVAKGGTGNTTGTATKLAAAAIVGTVSQSAGLPTGSIIETGSNANGTYIKYADGTLICRVSATASPYTITLSVNTNLFVSSSIAFTFPVAFISFPSIDPFAVSATGYFVWPCIEGSANSSGFTMRLMSPINTATSFAGYIAIGRWF